MDTMNEKLRKSDELLVLKTNEVYYLKDRLIHLQSKTILLLEEIVRING